MPEGAKACAITYPLISQMRISQNNPPKIDNDYRVVGTGIRRGLPSTAMIKNPPAKTGGLRLMTKGAVCSAPTC